MTKLAQGMLDLHSKRGTLDLGELAALAAEAGASAALAEKIAAANTAAEAFADAAHEGIALGERVAQAAQVKACDVLEGCDIAVEVAVFDRDGVLVGRAPFAGGHEAPPRNRR
jgi:cobalt-precorrin-5B (C1)-methyltransferase